MTNSLLAKRDGVVLDSNGELSVRSVQTGDPADSHGGMFAAVAPPPPQISYGMQGAYNRGWNRLQWLGGTPIPPTLYYNTGLGGDGQQQCWPSDARFSNFWQTVMEVGRPTAHWVHRAFTLHSARPHAVGSQWYDLGADGGADRRLPFDLMNRSKIGTPCMQYIKNVNILGMFMLFDKYGFVTMCVCSV